VNNLPRVLQLKFSLRFIAFKDFHGFAGFQASGETGEHLAVAKILDDGSAVVAVKLSSKSIASFSICLEDSTG